MKPETEAAIHMWWFLMLTAMGGISVWKDETLWAVFSFSFAVVCLVLALVAASEVEEDGDDSKPPSLGE